jgi:ADP-L-glycero-D-manno-heptose 6-epimerase
VPSKKLVITGAAGFIASNLVHRLNAEGLTDLILVDKFDQPTKAKNLEGAQFTEKIDRDVFLRWLSENAEQVDFIFHLGARTDTTESDQNLLNTLNFDYTKELWKICTAHHIPLLYASSAATYGLGEYGFDDNTNRIPDLRPLNPYGISKQLFDAWVLEEQKHPPFWVGLKFFNVYGPHEEHKGRMASVVLHAYRQIAETGKVKLFKSHKPNYKDGEQLRDFIYVDDVLDACLFFYHHRANSGIYNLGTGKARTFNDLVKAIFRTLGKPAQIEYIDIPLDIRDKYQYFTEAKMGKLNALGSLKQPISVEKGIEKYISYLKTNK